MLEETSSYNISRINKEIANQDRNARLIDVIQNSFIVGEEYTREEVKKSLQSIYSSCNVEKRVTASTIKEYFEVVEKSKREKGKKVKVIEIIKPL